MSSISFILGLYCGIGGLRPGRSLPKKHSPNLDGPSDKTLLARHGIAGGGMGLVVLAALVGLWCISLSVF